jgi:phage protein D
MFTRCDDTVCPMTASRLRPSRPTDKWQHPLSSRTTTGTELASRQLIQSANRNTVESNETKSNNKSKSPMKEKANEQILDTSDLLIECRLLVSDR